MASTIIPFLPSASANFQFQCTLDGAPYNVICTFNPYAQRYYITIYDLTGQEILSRPLIASPSFANVSLTLGYFETTMIYRESSRVFEIPGIPPVPLTRPPMPAYTPPGPPPPPPPAPPDPYFANVVLLLHGEGATGSTDIVDSSIHHTILTKAGSGTIAVENSQLYFPGGALSIPVGAYLYSLDSLYDFNGQSFTVEGWFYIPTLVNGDRAMALWSTGQPGSTIAGQSVFFIDTDGTVELYASDDHGNNPHDLASAPGAFANTGRWAFLSVTQVILGGGAANPGNQSYIHLDGELIASRVGPFNGAFANGIAVANYGWQTSNLPLGSYVQEYRVTLGVARYTSAPYAVPTQRFPDY